MLLTSWSSKQIRLPQNIVTWFFFCLFVFLFCFVLFFWFTWNYLQVQTLFYKQAPTVKQNPSSSVQVFTFFHVVNIAVVFEMLLFPWVCFNLVNSYVCEEDVEEEIVLWLWCVNQCLELPSKTSSMFYFCRSGCSWQLLNAFLFQYHCCC